MPLPAGGKNFSEMSVFRRLSDKIYRLSRKNVCGNEIFIIFVAIRGTAVLRKTIDV